MSVPPPPALALAAVYKHYRVGLRRRRHAVLRGVDLSVERGQTLGLVGANGSGKSTLLRLVAGVHPPSAGSVAVLGGAPTNAAVRRRVGWAPEDSPFPRELSAASALDLLASLQGVGRRERRARVAAHLDAVGLAAHARTPLAGFSRGMLRRFGLAQAFVHEPELVLLDEPTAGLDAPGYGVLERLLDDARARGATLVLSSHVLSDLHRHCERIAVLARGVVALDGTPAELAARGAHVELEIAGADDAAIAAAERALAEHGARVVARGPSRTLLLELYRSLDEAAPR